MIDAGLGVEWPHRGGASIVDGGSVAPVGALSTLEAHEEEPGATSGGGGCSASSASPRALALGAVGMLDGSVPRVASRIGSRVGSRRGTDGENEAGEGG